MYVYLSCEDLLILKQTLESWEEKNLKPKSHHALKP